MGTQLLPTEGVQQFTKTKAKKKTAELTYPYSTVLLIIVSKFSVNQ